MAEAAKCQTDPCKLARMILSMSAGLAGQRFFVDLAANHPTYGSSTKLLEVHGWDGLCIEPNPEYVKMLRAQRTCALAEVAVDSMERNMTFRLAGQMSGIEDVRFDNHPHHSDRNLTVQTQLLTNVLRNKSAPREIDYLSLDVEGAESEVLCPSFAWKSFIFLTLSIERPPPDLNTRLFQNGYATCETGTNPCT